MLKNKIKKIDLEKIKECIDEFKDEPLYFVCVEILRSYKTFEFIKNIINFPRKFKRFIIKMIKWVPLLWKDEDWDYAYLLEIMITKIELMIKLHEDVCRKSKYGERFVGQKKRIREMKIVVEHIKRYLNIWDYIGEVKIDIRFEDCDDTRLKKMVDYSPKHTQIKMKNLHKLEQWHLNEAFRKLNKWIQGWWD